MKGELLKTDQLLNGDGGIYRVVKRVGLAGATARVYRIKREDDGHCFALKIMQSGLTPEIQKHFQDEMRHLQRLRIAEEKLGTRHIPRIIESSDLQQPKSQELYRLLGEPFIIMDFAEGTDLETLLMEKTFLGEKEALEIAVQFAEVLAAVHGEGFTYTDMKLGNLFWDEVNRHLTVIDWNVIARDRLVEDAPKDRLRAAAYYFQSVTGIPITIEDKDPKNTGGSGTGIGFVHQKFRRWANFKKLSETTRRFFLTAFHPEPTSRHGNGGAPEQCTINFLKDLETRLRRFRTSDKDLVAKGEQALEYRQWQDALEYLDLAGRIMDIETDPSQFTRLQENLERARYEAGKEGRSAFFSGHGGYSNNLFAEALEDFKRAMQDDPYDEEARFYAIITQFALQAGESMFAEAKDALEGCIKALLNNHLDIAKNALSRLTPEARTFSAVGSLAAEIDVRFAVAKGRNLLKNDQLEEARECFQNAYRQRDSILYVEPLEENLGSLDQLYRQVENLRRHYEEGDAYFEEERYKKAAWEFWKAREISQGSPKANKKYLAASKFSIITKHLDANDPASALSICDDVSGSFGDEPKYKLLKNRVLDARCDQLRKLADEALKVKEYKTSTLHLNELLALKPGDESTKRRLAEISREISGDILEEIAQWSYRLKQQVSLKDCSDALSFVRQYSCHQFPEGKELLEQAEKLSRDIVLLSRRLEDATASGDLDAQMGLLNEAASSNWILEQGDPTELKKNLVPQMTDGSIAKIETHIKYAELEAADQLCTNLLNTTLLSAQEIRVRQLKETTGRYSWFLAELKKIKNRQKQIGTDGKEAGDEELELGRNYLRVLADIRQLEPQPEAPSEINRFEELKDRFNKELNRLLQENSQKALLYSENNELEAAHHVAAEMEHRIVFLKEFSGEKALDSIHWETWLHNFRRLILLLESFNGDTATIHPEDGVYEILRKAAHITGDSRIKSLFTHLRSPLHEEPDAFASTLEKLAEQTEESPVASWLHDFLHKRFVEKRCWEMLDQRTPGMETFIAEHTDAGHQNEYDAPIKTINHIKHFIERQEQLEQPGNTPIASIAPLTDLVEEGKRLLTDLRQFPQLDGGETCRELEERVNTLERDTAILKQKYINEFSTNLEQTLRQLNSSWEDETARLDLEDRARVEIKQLKQISTEDGLIFEERLQNLVEELRNKAKAASLKKRVEEVNKLMDTLRDTTEDHIQRLTIEDKTRLKIDDLREHSESAAAVCEKRLDHLLEELMRTPLSNPSEKHWRRLQELQRRICSQYLYPPIYPELDTNHDPDIVNFNDTLKKYLKKLNRDPYFREVIPDYRVKRENALIKLKKLKKQAQRKIENGQWSNTDHLEQLFQLREEYGEYPEINAAATIIGNEIEKEKNSECFQHLYNDFRMARRKEEWDTLNNELENINKSLLSIEEQERFSKIKNEIINQQAIRAIIDKTDVYTFLATGHHPLIKQWLTALEWSVREKNCTYKPFRETVNNIEEGELLWLKKGQLNVESLIGLRRIRLLLGRIYRVKESVPTGPASKSRQNSRSLTSTPQNSIRQKGERKWN